jgi:hypothetical protein
MFGLGVLTRINVAIAAPAMLVYLVAVSQAASAPGETVRGTGVRGASFARVVDSLGLRRIDARTLRNAAAFVIPNAAALAVILALNYVRYENAFSIGERTPGNQFTLGNALVGMYGYLFSPGRSVFLYSPPALLGLFGARRFYQLHRAEALLFAAIACTYVVGYAGQDLWHGGWGWGPRYMLPVVPLLVISSAYVMESRRGIMVAVALGVAGFAVQVLGTVENVSFVTWAHWMNGTTWDDTFLWVPGISPIPTHLKDLLHDRNVDLWLLYVRDHFGTGAMLATLAVPASLLAASALLLRDFAPRPHAPRAHKQSDGA